MDCSSFGQSKKEPTIEKLVIQNVSSGVSSIDAEKKKITMFCFPLIKKRYLMRCVMVTFKKFINIYTPKRKLLLLDSI